MLFAGFDLGSKCGYAVLDEDGNIIESGTWRLGKRTGSSMYTFYDNVKRLLTLGVEHVGYEKVHGRHASKNAAHAYGGYEAVLWMSCHQCGVLTSEIEQVTVQAVKKTATGFADASKEEVEAATYAKWDIIPEDDNESDALWIAESVRRKKT